MSKDPTPQTSISGDVLYDSLMATIEPELLIANLENIKDLARSETLEQRTTRAKRYSKAFEAYDRALKAHTAEWNTSFHAYKTHVLKSLEQGVSKVEDDAISSIEHSIQAQ